MPAARPPTHSIWATFLPARSAALAIVSACNTPAPENDVRLLNVSPERKNVLFVDPCSDGYVPVAIEYQPTPVFGGNDWSMPLLPTAPWSINDCRWAWRRPGRTSAPGPAASRRRRT